jgi:hypothetical protein
MTFLHPISNELTGITSKEKPLENSDYLNLPDLQFLLWCQQKYKVNKGIYNTIDCWFYEYGIVNIHHRRIYILAFLEFVKNEGTEHNKYIQFGKGGLTRKLYQFIKGHEFDEYTI